MPQVKQPATLFNIALPITASCIRAQCDAILLHHGDVTKPAFKEHIESYNHYLRREVPANVLDRIRLHQNLAVFLYFNITSLTVQEETLENTPIHKHIIQNVCPRLKNVTCLNLSRVEGTLDLFRAISIFCAQLRCIIFNPALGKSQLNYYHGELRRRDEAVCIWLLYLTRCKKLQVIRRAGAYEDFYLRADRYLNHGVVARIVRSLPELSEFKNAISPTLAMEEMRMEMYKIAHIVIGNGLFMSAEEIQWLNLHCPSVNQVVYEPEWESNHDTVFQALALTDLRIKSFEIFSDVPLYFNESMTMFFREKGKFIQDLFLYYFDHHNNQELTSATRLSYDNIECISQSCPSLKRLSLHGVWWYNEQILTPVHMKTKRLFPNLEQFYLRYHQQSIVPVILKGLTNLTSLHCLLDRSVITIFGNVVDAIRNTFTLLTDVKIEVYREINDVDLSGFLRRFIPIAIKWPNIRKICMQFPWSILPPDATNFVEEVKNLIKEQNLDLSLVVEGCWK